MTNVVLSSADRSSGTSQNGTIKLNSFSLNGEFKIKRFTMTNSIYAVDGSNNRIYIDEDGNPFTATLSSGSYTSSELATELKIQLELVGAGTYTITYNAPQHTFTIAVSGVVVLKFLFASNTLNSGRLLIGFNDIDTVGSASDTSDFPIQLQKNETIYFNFPDSGNKTKTSTNIDTTFIISGSSNLGEVLRQEYVSDNILVSFSNKNCIDYFIHDKDGVEIDLREANWVLEMEKV